MKTIVSVTPLPIISDSRTYKIAASFARFGYRSIAVEGQPSPVETSDLPFELRPIGNPSPEGSSRAGVMGSMRGNMLARVPGAAELPLRMASAVARFSCEYGWRVARALPPASLYYLHAPYQFPGVYFAARRYRVPIIYDAHDFYPLVDRLPFLEWVESWCIRNSDQVVTVSKGVADLLSKQYKCSPTVIRNVHDHRLDKEPTNGLRESLGVSPDQFLLVCVGQAKPGQHVEGAMQAMKKLPSSVHLAFVGNNTDQYQKQALQHGIEDRIHTLPPVNPEEVVPFIRSANAAILLYTPISRNYEYCLPNGLFQSLAASLPLLYPTLTEIQAVMEHTGSGIPINPYSTDSIVMAVSILIEDLTRLRGYRAAACAASTKFSWETEERILEDLVLKILV